MRQDQTKVANPLVALSVKDRKSIRPWTPEEIDRTIQQGQLERLAVENAPVPCLPPSNIRFY